MLASVGLWLALVGPCIAPMEEAQARRRQNPAQSQDFLSHCNADTQSDKIICKETRFQVMLTQYQCVRMIHVITIHKWAYRISAEQIACIVLITPISANDWRDRNLRKEHLEDPLEYSVVSWYKYLDDSCRKHSMTLLRIGFLPIQRDNKLHITHSTIKSPHCVHS